MSSRRRMLKRGLYCLMKLCSASSASASVANDDALDVLDGGDHLRVPGAARHLRLGEVRGDALADRLRLADVDHAPRRVAEQVDARLVRERAALRFSSERLSPASCASVTDIALEDRRVRAGARGAGSSRSICAGVAEDLHQRVHDEGDDQEPQKLPGRCSATCARGPCRRRTRARSPRREGRGARRRGCRSRPGVRGTREARDIRTQRRARHRAPPARCWQRARRPEGSRRLRRSRR